LWPTGLLAFLIVYAIAAAIVLNRKPDPSAKEDVYAALEKLEARMTEVCTSEGARDDELAAFLCAQTEVEREAALLHALADAPIEQVVAFGPSLRQRARPSPTLTAKGRCRFPAGANLLEQLVDDVGVGWRWR
jgi:hypothetical protein